MMSVTVDDEPLAADSLGLATLGQVLSHLKQRNRLVVHVMIDGREPDFAAVPSVRAQPIADRAVYIETVEPRQIAADVFGQVGHLLDESEELRAAAVEHLAAGDHCEALKKLGGCFTAWTQAQTSVEQVAKLLRIDLDRIELDGTSLSAWLKLFAGQLAEIRAALENRDYPLLGDLLAYETADANGRWGQAIEAIRAAVE